MKPDDFDIDKQTNDVLNMRTQWVAQAADSRRRLMAAWPRLRTVLRLLPGEPLMYIHVDWLRIECKLPSMKAAEPILASLEDATGGEFNRTDDDAVLGQRAFKMGDFPLEFVVDVSGNDDDESASCRRIIVGQEIVPTYKLVCDDDQPAGPAEQPL